jgi:hypothetical protein
MDKIKKVKAIGNIIGFNIDASGNETYNVQFPDMTIAELESYQFEEADAYRANEKPLYLRNVLARLRELPEHDRKAWLKGIMDEFELDFSHAKWREGYEQGKFEGAVEAEKSNKVVIPQFVADIIEEYKDRSAPIIDIFTEKKFNKKYNWWLATSLNAYDRTARAWLDGYDVEQEKRYTVKIKGNLGQYLGRYYLNNEELTPQFIRTQQNDPSYFTKAELERTGFGWVFDCEGVKVQEVQEVE